jgi:hypothetical protein
MRLSPLFIYLWGPSGAVTHLDNFPKHIVFGLAMPPRPRPHRHTNRTHRSRVKQIPALWVSVPRAKRV